MANYGPLAKRSRGLLLPVSFIGTQLRPFIYILIYIFPTAAFERTEPRSHNRDLLATPRHLELGHSPSVRLKPRARGLRSRGAEGAGCRESPGGQRVERGGVEKPQDSPRPAVFPVP